MSQKYSYTNFAERRDLEEVIEWSIPILEDQGIDPAFFYQYIIENPEILMEQGPGRYDPSWWRERAKREPNLWQRFFGRHKGVAQDVRAHNQALDQKAADMQRIVQWFDRNPASINDPGNKNLYDQAANFLKDYKNQYKTFDVERGRAIGSQYGMYGPTAVPAPPQPTPAPSVATPQVPPEGAMPPGVAARGTPTQVPPDVAARRQGRTLPSGPTPTQVPPEVAARRRAATPSGSNIDLPTVASRLQDILNNFQAQGGRPRPRSVIQALQQLISDIK